MNIGVNNSYVPSVQGSSLSEIGATSELATPDRRTEYNEEQKKSLPS